MVPLELQGALKREIEQIASTMEFKTPKGECSALNVYEQNLPMRMHTRLEHQDTDEEEDEDEDIFQNFPYCVVKLDTAESESAEDALVVKTVILIGIFDDSIVADGYKNILILFEKIRERFRKNPVLDDRFLARDKISWALQDEDEDTFPYFFGGMYLEWSVPEFRREDDLA